MCGNLLVPLIVSHSYESEATVRQTSEIINRELRPSQQVMSDNDGIANDSRNLHNPQKGDEVVLPEEVEGEKPLPAGWEAIKTATGLTFYVDYINRRTQWKRPKAHENTVERDVQTVMHFFLIVFSPHRRVMEYFYQTQTKSHYQKVGRPEGLPKAIHFMWTTSIDVLSGRDQLFLEMRYIESMYSDAIVFFIPFFSLQFDIGMSARVIVLGLYVYL